MKRIRHTPEQIIRKLKTAEQLLAQGKTVADVCRALEVAQPTYHRWRQQYGGMKAEEAKRLSQLEKENGRLKKLLAEAELRHRLREIAAEHIRWGRRMAYRLLRREGWRVNHKRVHLLWREEGLQRPTPRKQKRARPVDGSVRRNQAEHPHQVWAMDFQFDATADGRRLKFLNVINEHSRLCLAIRVGGRCKANDVVSVLEELSST
jgi:transposase-like protein